MRKRKTTHLTQPHTPCKKSKHSSKSPPARSPSFWSLSSAPSLTPSASPRSSAITAFTDATTVTVSTSDTVAADEGTIWYVNQTALDTYAKRSNTYANDSGANGSTFLIDTWTHKRTFLFSVESGTVTYREIGWSWNNSSTGGDLFGRALLAGSGVTLVGGQQLKVVVELAVTYAPATPQPWTNTITGWNTDGECGFESLDDAGKVNSDGSSGSGGSGVSISPDIYHRIALHTASTAMRPAANAKLGVSGKIVEKSATFAAYSSGSFRRDRYVTFNVSEGNNTNIRSICINGYATDGVFRVLLDTPETKDSDHTLTITFTMRWGRILVN